MKRLLLTITLLACVLISQAQESVETYYYDPAFAEVSDENKAKYKKVVTRHTDGLENIQILYLAKNCVILEENYKENHPAGVWTMYSENCSLESKRDFSEFVYSDQQVDTLFDNRITDDNPENYEKAQYGSEEIAIYQFLQWNLKYPQEARDAGISGTVYLQFIIKADGSIKMVSIMRSAHPYLDYEAWELIRNMPKWNPAKKDGQPIDSYYILPIKFSLK